MLKTPGLEGFTSVDHVFSGDQHFGWLKTVIGTEKHAEPYFTALRALLKETRARLSLLGDVWDLTYASNEAIKGEFDLFRPVFELAPQQGKIKVILSDHEPDMDHNRLAAAIGEEAASWFDIKPQHLYEGEENLGTVMTHGHLLMQPEVLEALKAMPLETVESVEHLEKYLMQDPALQDVIEAIKHTDPKVKKASLKICEWDAQRSAKSGKPNTHTIRNLVEHCLVPRIWRHEQNALKKSSAEIKRLLPHVDIVLTAHTHMAGSGKDMFNAGSISAHAGRPGVIVQGVHETGARVTRLLLLNKKGEFERSGEDRVVG